jgi:hypothetical protein
MAEESKIINRLEAARRENNTNWMDLMRLASKYAPEAEFKAVIRGIVNKDAEIMKLARELAE